MKGNFSDKQALALIAGCRVPKEQIKPFGKMVADQFGEIGKAEKMTAVRVVLLGHGFNVMKNSLERGEFRPWTVANVTRSHIWSEATAAKNVALYMRVWHAFLKQYKPSQPELLAITGGSSLDPDLSKAKGESAKLIKAISDWVGERSATEVIREEVLDKVSSAGGGGTLPVTGEDPLLADTAEHLMGLRAILLDPKTVKRFTAAQLQDIEKQWASGLEQFRKLLAKMRA